MPEEKTTALYNVHEGVTGRDGGPYLDQEIDRAAEIRRAAIEGREPNFDSMAASAGTPLVTAGQLLAASQTSNVPSQENNLADIQGKVGASAEQSWPVEPVAEVTTTVPSPGDPQPADPTLVAEKDISGNPNTADGYSGDTGYTGSTARPENQDTSETTETEDNDPEPLQFADAEPVQTNDGSDTQVPDEHVNHEGE